MYCCQAGNRTQIHGFKDRCPTIRRPGNIAIILPYFPPFYHCAIFVLITAIAVISTNTENGDMREKYGHIEQKILLTLVTGGILLLNPQSKYSWKLIKAAAEEWKGINERSLGRAVQRLHTSKDIRNMRNADGTIK